MTAGQLDDGRFHVGLIDQSNNFVSLKYEF